MSAIIGTGNSFTKNIRAFNILPLFAGNDIHKTYFGFTLPPGVCNTTFADLVFFITIDRKCSQAQLVRTHPALAPGSANTSVLITLPFHCRIGTLIYHLTSNDSIKIVSFSFTTCSTSSGTVSIRLIADTIYCGSSFELSPNLIVVSDNN